ncbi:MAG TPA: hypothetical protein PL110_05920 [Candidatus Eremiobacteraeota bacterium]|nr:MAG: hypothetical protein BWY64_01051 [bacterium ADurb.Bin363]HPZ07630.1 hypothetical protein [Candidatus Eremiobacteraeota bacterium]
MEEIYSHLDRLQRMLEAKFKIPLTDLIIINQMELLDLISEIQESIPEELARSIKIKEDINNMTEKTIKQAEEIIKKAQILKLEKIDERTEIRESYQSAKERLNKAREIENTEIKEIQEYSEKIFDNIEEKIRENFKNVQTARDMLKQKKISSHGEGEMSVKD